MFIQIILCLSSFPPRCLFVEVVRDVVVLSAVVALVDDSRRVRGLGRNRCSSGGGGGRRSFFLGRSLLGGDGRGCRHRRRGSSLLRRTSIVRQDGVFCCLLLLSSRAVGHLDPRHRSGRQHVVPGLSSPALRA